MPEAFPLPAFEPISLVGTMLDGRYELSAHLATGGMGAVFRARHVHLRKDVAVKVLRPDLTASAEIVERFRREAEIASALEHDNIVKVTDFGRSAEGYLFIVMELLTGEGLFDRLRREGFLSPEDAVPILWQVCSGLDAAHARGVVHRDLKPENVFLARTSSGREVTKILDFGIAKIADPENASTTASGIVVGTPEYLAPEQAMGTDVDARADVYAVGLIAWRALAGRHPFKAEDPRALLMMQATRPVPPLTDPRPDLAAYPALCAAVAKACAKDPAARHQTAAALGSDLRGALGPAFLLPPGATPLPSVPTPHTPLPARIPDRAWGVRRAAAETGATLEAAPALSPTPSEAQAMALGRLRLRAVRLGRRVRDGARALPQRLLALLRRAGAAVRAHPFLSGAVLLALAIATAAWATLAWQHGRAAAEARALLAAEKPAEAIQILDGALERRPEDPELLLLRAHALQASPGQATAAVEAYATARARGPLDDAARASLAASLGLDRSLADRAARVLRDEGAPAVPAVTRAVAEAQGVHRLRLLGLARDLGAEEQVDRIAAYGELLEDSDCDVRRLAARRLGEIGDAAALPALSKAAGKKVGTRGIFGRMSYSPACGAPDAAAAVRRIKAARLP